MPELKLAEEGRIAFNLGALFRANETEPVPRGPVIFFLELGRWPTPQGQGANGPAQQHGGGARVLQAIRKK
jgi:hypothetical protein